MSVITRVPEPNLWDEICRGFTKQRPPYDDDAVSVSTVEEDYDPAKHNPVFFSGRNQIAGKLPVDVDPLEDFDSSRYHPSAVGYSFVQKPPKSPPPPPPTPPNRKTCAPKEFLDHHVFPVLLPALEEMLKSAKTEKCFERKRTKFNALDFLTEYLYSHNPNKESREGTKLEEIPFVCEHWKSHPRPPLPKSLVWTEDEALLKIQSFWRGYKIRCDTDIQELRVWQKEWREENSNIKEKVDDFWSKQMPGEGENENNNASEIAGASMSDMKSTDAVKTESVPKTAGSSRPASRSVTMRSPIEDEDEGESTAAPTQE